MTLIKHSLPAGALASLLLLSPLAAFAAERPDFAPLEAQLVTACEAGEFSGVLAVARRGEMLFQHVCGQADPVNGVANTTETRFKIFSTSKYLTAIAILRLCENGEMDLDAPIGRYLADAPASWAGVTVRNLLTSGLPDLTEAMLARFSVDHPTAMKAVLNDLPEDETRPLEAPGENFRYNNFGFELLAHAAAATRGETFDRLLDELVLKPAGMTTASVEAPNLVAGHPVAVQEEGLAIGYNGAPGALTQAENWAFIQLGAGAVRASLADMLALDRALDEGRLLKPDSLAEMRAAPVVSRDGKAVVGPRGYGLGVVVSSAAGQAMVGHSGGTNGYIADFEQLPDQDAVLVILTNRGFTRLQPLREQVGRAFTAVATGGGA
ncbi:MAG: beta-lactamase family protein [Brevundimonas sp.]|nr:beta-lactamase family protein [Brevundimonas sp.]